MSGCLPRRRMWLLAAVTIAACSLASEKAAAQFGGGGGGSEPQRDYDAALAFSSDGKVLAGGGGDKLRFWDVRTGELLRTVTLPVRPVYCVEFAPQSRTLYAGCQRGHVYACDADTGELNLAFDADAHSLNAMAFAPDGGLLACATEERTDVGFRGKSLRLWDVRRQNLMPPLFIENDATILDLRFSPDGKTLAATVSQRTPPTGEIRLWDVATGTWKRGFTVANLVKSVDFAPDGKTLAIGGTKRWNGGTYEHRRGVVSVWNLDKGTVVWELTSLEDGIFQIAYSPDGQSIVGGTSVRQALPEGGFTTVGELSLWDAETGRTVWRVIGERHTVLGLAFSPDGEFIASSCVSETKLSDSRTGETRFTLLSNE